MKKPSVSVAMTTYNGGLYLRQQVESFVEQARRPDELIVTDDGSTDDTLKILENFQATAPFEVKVYQNPERLGFSRNFERAMSLCSGDVIFLSDQDDVWFSNKIALVIPRFVSDQQVMVVINDQIICDENLAHQGTTRLQEIRSLGRDDSAFIPGCCTALRREWRDLSLPVPACDMTYDGWLNKLAVVLGVRLVLAEPLQLYRLHASNTSQCKLSLTPSKKRSFFDRLRACALQDSRHYWLTEKRDKEFYRLWIEERDGVLRSAGLAGKKERTSQKLGTEIRALEKRTCLMDLPRGLRVPAVVRLLLEGGYTSFSGWKSALNDVLR